MSKMHELLAVFDDQKNQANKVRTELTGTFTAKSHLFRKKITTFQPIAENSQPVTEAQSDINTTLSKELEWVSAFLTKAIDSGYQIDMGNTQVKADLIITDKDGKEQVLATGVPATFLLQLEKHLVNVRDMAATIPTLDPAQGFELDKAAGKGIYRAREVKKTRTKKDKKVLTLYPATDKHPAQVQAFDEDVVTGNILEQEWSALTTPSIKSEILARCDMMIQAVKKARSRANSTDLDVSAHKIGEKLLKYVFAPLE